MIRTLVAALAASALLAPAVLGQPAPGPAQAPAAPQYQVEVLIFAYRDMDLTEERFQFTRPAPTPQTLRTPPLYDESSLAQIDPDPTLPPSAGDLAAEPTSTFRVLRPDELQLTAEYRKIERVPTYVPLLHAGWIQPGLPEDQAQPIDMAMLGAANPMGTIRVDLRRFLRVRLELTYQAARGAEAGRPAFGDGLSEVDVAPRYELVAEQQTRSGELRYFDHPAFGVLVKITPVPVNQTNTGSRPAA
jgi:peptidoglycan-binding protein CsiV